MDVHRGHRALRPLRLAGASVSVAGGLVWALGGLAIGGRLLDVDPSILLGALAVALGPIPRVWPTGGLVGRIGLGAAVIGAVALFGPWPAPILGQLAFLAGLLAIAIAGLRRGLQPRPAFGLLGLAAVLTVALALAGRIELGLVSVGSASLILGLTGFSGGRIERWLGVLVGAGSAAVLGLTLAASAGIVTLPGRAGPVPQRTDPLPPMPVVIDTDMLQDDWLAIIYLASEPTVDLRAVTVTGTTALYCEGAVDTARRLLAAVGKPDVPVACGRRQPLRGDHAFPVEWGANALLAFDKLGLPEVSPRPDATSGAERLLADAIRGSDRPVTLVALGPLTDVAEALGADPSLRERLDRIVIMGGAVGVAGNVAEAPTAEWNVYVDPAAADAVFRSGEPITMVALDATDRVPLSVAFIDRLAADRTTPAASLAARILEGYRDFAASGGAFIWDPLAAAVAREPRLVTTRSIEVAVVQDGPEAGRTIEAPGTGATVLLATDANGSSFESLFIDVLNGRLP